MAVALTLIFYDMRGDSLKPARAWTAWSLTPVLWLASVPAQLVDMARGIDTRNSIEQQNAALKQQQFVLSAQLSKMEALAAENRSEEHTSELQSLMRISYAVFCLTKKHKKKKTT